MGNKETTAKKGKGKKIWGVTWRVLCGLLAFICTAVVLFVMVDRIRFGDFYKVAESTFDVPGTNEGYVAQGFDYDKERKVFLATGYMANDKPSRVYVLNGWGGEYYSCLANEDGSAYTGHTGGIVHNGDYVYITGEDGLDVFSYQEILVGTPIVKKVGEIKTYIDPAYCYIAGEYLLVGSFYRAENFETAEYERMFTPTGEYNPALITAFKLDETHTETFGVNPTPCAVISTRKKVQGMCMTDSGKIVLSTSYAMSDSVLYVYDSAKVVETLEYGYSFKGVTEDGEAFDFTVARAFLDSNSCIGGIKAPSMSEELVYLDGKIYIMNESASNRYLFGKLTGGRKIYAYPYA